MKFITAIDFMPVLVQGQQENCVDWQGGKGGFSAKNRVGGLKKAEKILINAEGQSR
jgi:hypothetical protein